MLAAFTIMTLLAVGAAADEAYTAARRALALRKARRACAWQPRRPDPRPPLLRLMRR